MYVKPTLEKFGTFRELTMVGWNANADNNFILGNSGAGGGCYVSQDGRSVICPVSS
jgi:hypothetical protein